LIIFLIVLFLRCEKEKNLHLQYFFAFLDVKLIQCKTLWTQTGSRLI
jgi:hypothetical protein